MSTALLLFAALGVGTLIGAVGVGGILLIPALSLFGGLAIQHAMATALFTFILTGLIGTFLFQRRGSIAWHVTVPLCAGAALFGFAGAWANSRIDGTVLATILAAVILFAGAYTLFTPEARRHAAWDGRPGAQRALLLGIGAVSGFGSGLTGVGGPALSVPMMVLFGFPSLVSIGASQVIQVLAAVSGTVGNLKFGAIDFALAIPVALVEVVGVHLGVRIAHAVDARSLRRFVGVLCLVVGVSMLGRY